MKPLSKMKTFILAAALLVTGGLLPAKAADSGKLSPDIQQLVKQHQQGRRATADGTVCAFVRFTTADADGLLALYGCQKVTQQGDIYIANIPLQALPQMAADDRVVRIEAQLGGRLLNDVSPTWTGSSKVSAGTGLPQAFTGQGVLLGIVDSGFDVTHPAFYGTDGTTYRIKGFVDDLSAPDETLGVATPLGREYTTQADILGNKHPGDSKALHATHCLGTAAGSGYGTPYRGVAYEADIFAVNSVKAGDDMYMSSADQAARMKRIFDAATAMNKPCVITYSIGFNYLPGDGDLFQEFLEQCLGPGRILVAAAGNSNMTPTYVHKPAGVFTAGTGLTHRNGYGRAFLFSEKPFKVKCLTYKLYGGKYTLNDSVTFDSSNLPADTTRMRGHRLVVEHKGAYYQLTDRFDAPIESDGHTLLLAIEGTEADVEMTSAIESGFSNMEPEMFDGTRFLCGEKGHNIGLPATMDEVVTIGALNCRETYTTPSGPDGTHFGQATPLGSVAVFSSVGPTLDGRMKPDAVSPGVNVISAGNSYSQDAFGSSMVTTTTFNGREYPWLAASGTSMATPHAAGIVALWLQADPTLTPERVKEVFKATCKPIVGVDNYPDNSCGYGLIDAYEGVLHILGLPSAIEHLSLHQPSALTIRPTAGGRVSLQFRTRPTQPFTVRIYTTGGQLVSEQTLQPTQAMRYEVALPQRAQGVHVVQVNGQEQGVTGSELVRL